MDAKTFFNERAALWDTHERATRGELEEVLSHALLKRGDHVLDLGCGTGVISGILEDFGCLVTGLDLSENMIAIAREKYAGRSIRLLCGDFYEYEGRDFDAVVVFNAYPHFLDRERFAARLFSSLKTGGSFTVLHNFSRKKIDECHSSVMEFSRRLLPAEEEARFFERFFTIEETLDGENIYCIRGRKTERKEEIG